MLRYFLPQNKQLDAFVEYMSPLLKDVMPQSFGDCASVDHMAPAPCTGSESLAFIRTDAYEATARWVTGLKMTHLDVVRFSAAPQNRYEAADYKHAVFGAMSPISARI